MQKAVYTMISIGKYLVWRALGRIQAATPPVTAHYIFELRRI
jgi:hypothetical protein